MQVSDEIQQVMQQTSGMVPMETNIGIQAFYQALASQRSQVAVVQGDPVKIRGYLGLTTETKTTVVGLSKEKAERYFIELLSSTLKLPIERISSTVPMEEFGIDSLLVVQMTNELEKIFGPLSKTLFSNTRPSVS